MMLHLLLMPAFAFSQLTELPPELRTFLGKPPAQYTKSFQEPAEKMAKALNRLAERRDESAMKDLAALAAKGEMAEHAGYELASIYRERKDFSRSTTAAQKLILDFPGSPYRELAQEIVDDNTCDQGLADSKARSKRSIAKELLFRCLQRSSWKEWAEREEEVAALYDILKSTKDILFGSFVAEIIQALPSSSPLRVRVQREVKDADLRTYADLARFRSRYVAPAGVKAVNPDVDLFDQAMQAAVDARWSDANGLFKRFTQDFPQSEHLDRAQYWVARTYDLLGKEEDAKRGYEQIFTDSPLSYYGLRAALRLKKDFSLFLVPSDLQPAPLKGTLLPRQMLSLWRMRALLEQGLIDQARVEATALFQYRPGGATFGQDNPTGALMTALLYQTAGYSLATFSHAHAATTLDPATLNNFTLGMLFPDLFEKEYLAASDATGINPLLLLSITKQESAFIPNARSRANALGLMQLLLSTAREIDPLLDRKKLFQPQVNSVVGAKYFGKLLERFQGNIALALAAYNAGPTRAAQWQKKFVDFPAMKQGFDVDLFIDSIPFTETRKYVAAILRNYAWYKLMRKDGKLESIEELAFQWQKNPPSLPALEKTLPVPVLGPEQAPVPLDLPVPSATSLEPAPPAPAATH